MLLVNSMVIYFYNRNPIFHLMSDKLCVIVGPPFPNVFSSHFTTTGLISLSEGGKRWRQAVLFWPSVRLGFLAWDCNPAVICTPVVGLESVGFLL